MNYPRIPKPSPIHNCDSPNHNECQLHLPNPETQTPAMKLTFQNIDRYATPQPTRESRAMSQQNQSSRVLYNQQQEPPPVQQHNAYQQPATRQSVAVQNPQHYYPSPPQTPQVQRIVKVVQSPTVQLYPSQQIDQLALQEQLRNQEIRKSQEIQQYYAQIMQYYQELNQGLNSQQAENVQRYNELLYKIDGVHIELLQLIESQSTKQKQEYGLILSELKSQREENYKLIQTIILAQQTQQTLQLQQQQQIPSPYGQPPQSPYPSFSHELENGHANQRLRQNMQSPPSYKQLSEQRKYDSLLDELNSREHMIEKELTELNELQQNKIAHFQSPTNYSAKNTHQYTDSHPKTHTSNYSKAPFSSNFMNSPQANYQVIQSPQSNYQIIHSPYSNKEATQLSQSKNQINHSPQPNTQSNHEFKNQIVPLTHSPTKYSQQPSQEPKPSLDEKPQRSAPSSGLLRPPTIKPMSHLPSLNSIQSIPNKSFHSHKPIFDQILENPEKSRELSQQEEEFKKDFLDELRFKEQASFISNHQKPKIFENPNNRSGLTNPRVLTNQPEQGHYKQEAPAIFNQQQPVIVYTQQQKPMELLQENVDQSSYQKENPRQSQHSVGNEFGENRFYQHLQQTYPISLPENKPNHGDQRLLQKDVETQELTSYIYCTICDQFIAMKLADNHTQVCQQQKRHLARQDNYLDLFICCTGRTEHQYETKLQKRKRLTTELSKVSYLMGVAMKQKDYTWEIRRMREYSLFAQEIINQIVENPTLNLQQRYDDLLTIYQVLDNDPTEFFRQMVFLVQKAVIRVKELLLIN